MSGESLDALGLPRWPTEKSFDTTIEPRSKISQHRPLLGDAYLPATISKDTTRGVGARNKSLLARFGTKKRKLKTSHISGSPVDASIPEEEIPATLFTDTDTEILTAHPVKVSLLDSGIYIGRGKMQNNGIHWYSESSTRRVTRY
jgi:hypothetical protein